MSVLIAPFADVGTCSPAAINPRIKDWYRIGAIGVIAAMLLATSGPGAAAQQMTFPPGTIAGPPQQRLVKYEVIKETIGCRRTTDFEAAADALRQLDVQWFTENPNCRIFKKGAVAYLLADGFPLAKFCFGPESNCVPLWAPFDRLDAVYVPAKTLAQGALKICRDDPADAPEPASPEDYRGDIRLPAGLTFIDSGTLDNIGAEVIKVTVITTKRAVINRGTNCTVVPAKIVDDDSGPRDQPVERTLTAGQRRVLTAAMINGRVLENLPELFGTVAKDFR
jgi:hypothetical protein